MKAPRYSVRFGRKKVWLTRGDFVALVNAINDVLSEKPKPSKKKKRL